MGKKVIFKIVIIITSVLVLISGAMITSSQLTTEEVRRLVQQFEEREQPFQAGAENFKIHVIQVQQWLTDISATRGLDGLNDGLMLAAEHAGKARHLIDELSQLDPGNDPFYSEMEKSFESYYAAGETMARHYIDQGPAGGNPMMASFDQHAAVMTAVIDRLTTKAREQERATMQQLKQETSKLANLILALSLLFTTSMLGALFYGIKQLKPLANLQLLALSMADNDLSRDIPQTKGTNEIAQLINTFRQMQESLRDSVQLISDNADKVNRQTSEIRDLATASRDNILNQQPEVEHAALAVKQMNETVHEISRNTTATAEAARHASEEVDDGRGSLPKPQRQSMILPMRWRKGWKRSTRWSWRQRISAP